MWLEQEEFFVAVWNSGLLWGIQVEVIGWHLDLDQVLWGVDGIEFDLV